MGTRRILQGGEDIFPSDGPAAQGSRGTQFKLNTFFGVGSLHADGSSGIQLGVIWTPPANGMIVRNITLSMGSSLSNAPTNPGNVIAFVYPSDGGGGLLSFGLLQLSIPNTDWVSKGGGSGFNYNAGPQCNFTTNGSGPKGTYTDIDVATSTTQGRLCGASSSTVGSGKTMFWPWSDGTSTYSTFAFAMTLTGGDGAGARTIGATDFFISIEGSYL